MALAISCSEENETVLVLAPGAAIAGCQPSDGSFKCGACFDEQELNQDTRPFTARGGELVDR